MNAKTKKYVIIASIIVFSIIGRFIYLSVCEYNAFKEATNERNIKRCREFVEKYPDSKRLPELYDVMAQIEQDFYQQKLNKNFENIAYKDIRYYINTFPEGQYIGDVNQINSRFKDKFAFENAQKNNTSAAWNSYINKYPDGEYIKQAKANYKEALKREEKQRDHDDYASAKSLNTKTAWQAYLRQHPNGKYKSEAKAAIQEIDDYEYYSNYSLTNGSLPYRSVYGSNYSEAYGMSKVVVNAPYDCDVIVTARHINSDKVKGHVYVRANRAASFYIPEGRYKISFYYGNGWYPKKKMVGKHGTLYGGFFNNEIVEQEDVKFDANYINTFTLTKTTNGNFSAEPSNTYEMF